MTSSTRLLLVICATSLVLFVPQSMMFPALGPLREHYGATESELGWVMVAFLLANAVATPLAGRLGDVFGRRRVLLICLATFAVGCVVSALAPTMGVIIVGRVIQGAGASIVPLCLGIMREVLPGDQVSRGVGWLAATTGLGTGAGLVMGGLVSDHLPVAWVFWGAVVLAGADGAGHSAQAQRPAHVPPDTRRRRASLRSRRPRSSAGTPRVPSGPGRRPSRDRR